MTIVGQYSTGVMAAVALLISAVSATGANDEGGCDPVRDLMACRGELVRSVLLTGELREMRGVSITVPRTPSWQLPIRWMAENGSEVHVGDKILELDNAAFSADLENRRLALRRADEEIERQVAAGEAAVAAARFAFEQQRVNREKARIAAAVPLEVLPLRDVQERQLALERAEVEFAKAQDALVATEAANRADLEVRRIERGKAAQELDMAERAIRELTVYSPADGILVVAENPREGRTLQIGDVVWVGLTVMRIPDLSSMEVEASLADVDDGEIAVGMPARCTLDMYPDREFSGRVVEIAAAAQEPARQSLRRAFRVRIELDRTDPARMRPGMSVLAEVEAARIADAVLVPRAALDGNVDAPHVALGRGGSLPVKLGPCNAQVCAVTQGIDAGTAVRPSSGNDP